MTAIGATRWAIAEGYIPGASTGEGPAFESHETACLLNAGDAPARVAITLYFADREPVGPYAVTVPPRRTLHLRFNELSDPEPVPRDTDLCERDRVRRADRRAAHPASTPAKARWRYCRRSRSLPPEWRARAPWRRSMPTPSDRD